MPPINNQPPVQSQPYNPQFNNADSVPVLNKPEPQASPTYASQLPEQQAPLQPTPATNPLTQQNPQPPFQSTIPTEPIEPIVQPPPPVDPAVASPVATNSFSKPHEEFKIPRNNPIPPSDADDTIYIDNAGNLTNREPKVG